MIKENIFYIGPFTKSGGVSTFSYTLKHLDLDDYNIVPHNTFRVKNENYNSKVFIIQNILNFIIYFVGMFFRKEFYKTKKFHISVTSNFGFYEKAFLYFCLKIFRKKVLFHIHGGGFYDFYTRSRFKVFIKNILNNVDLLIVLSNSWKDIFQNKIRVTTQIEVLHNTIDFKEALENNKHSIENTFLFIGNLVKEKGLLDLLKVIEDNEVWLKENKCKFIICGKGDLEQTIIESHSELITFKGLVAGKIKDEIFYKSKYLILPSYIEGLPYVILEGMNYGLYVISTKVGAIPEIINSEKKGLLFEAGRKEELFKTIKKSITLEKKNTFSINRNIIKDCFSNQYIKRTLIKIYGENV